MCNEGEQQAEEQVRAGLKKAIRSIFDYSDTLMEYYELLFDAMRNRSPTDPK
jgi:hypothetical protein